MAHAALTLSEFTDLLATPGLSGLTLTADLEPVAGTGTPILPATYISDTPTKVALTLGGPHRVFDPATGSAVIDRNPDGTARACDSVVVSSIAAQVTRAETSLWSLRDALGLSGIVVDSPGDEIQDEVFDKAWKVVTKNLNGAVYDKDITRANLDRALAGHGDELSSWTLAHRHVDALIRRANDPARDLDPVWTPTDDPSSLYQRIISAGPNNLVDLMTFSPNSVLYGFWLSSSAPQYHKLARSTGGEIIGYGARHHEVGTTNATPMPAMSSVLTNNKGDIQIGKGPAGYARPSELNIGVTPVSADGSALYVCDNILSTSWLSVNALRRTLTTGGFTDPDQLAAAHTALSALGVLGAALVVEDTMIRSTCDLVPTGVSWSTVGRSGRQLTELSVDTPDLIDLATQAVDHAVDLGVMSRQRPRVEIGPRAWGIFVASHIQQLMKNDTTEGDA